ncbi:class I glutamine amidotransferase-like protein [Eremomyces bilateralis CBS 781.70]|uniref:Class I glutamine amidotransferase-like protein n=1 Tax=Eremomyces bilateralis CBS 781.70 TaxID=1392243 RepID=A0A6G1FYG8_9PEZI|nr:class I glutamine amidotransferase-like protein [Eremomyces bilateralis CBS 781.70]KAF1810762.1 class I glutamine amidotransferase-like protein [Eremomyces bilateralis CBS 781.70]
MSAIAETPVDGKTEPIQVLFLLHEGFDTVDFTGPMETFWYAKNDDISKPEGQAFVIHTVAEDERVISNQGIKIKADMDFEEAEDRLDEFDILAIPGGNVVALLDSKALDDLPTVTIAKAWCALQKKDPSRERTLFSICTGSLFLAKAGLLQGLSATTHPDHYTKFEILCQEAAKADSLVPTNVMEERYVVNNARFDLGPDLDENPFILSKKPDGRRPSTARKGSDAWKLSRRRESLVRRGQLPLGGMRVITAGGITAGLDATLYLIGALVTIEAAKKVAHSLQYVWNKGVTVEGIDV